MNAEAINFTKYFICGIIIKFKSIQYTSDK